MYASDRGTDDVTDIERLTITLPADMAAVVKDGWKP
jgi:hypothetical protein